MKIAFAVISNRPDRLVRFMDSIMNAAMVETYQYLFAFILQPPCNEKTEELIKYYLGERNVRIAHHDDYRCPDGRVVLGRARCDSYNLCEEADYVMICDDDCIYSRGTKTAHYTFGERIIDAVNHLEADKNCGLVSLRGFFGGHPFGRNIVPYMRQGYFNTEYGVVVRGPKFRGGPLIDPDLIAPGATEDVSIYFTTVALGYNLTKTFNCPAKFSEGTLHEVLPANKDVNYDADFIWSEEGVQGKFAKKYPPGWKLGGKLPKTLLAEYERKIGVAK